MDPDNPLLARAQAALKQQLTAARSRAEDELRAQQKLLAEARRRRESLGVELFSYQQQLAKIQLELDSSADAHSQVATRKDQEAGRVAELRSQNEKEAHAAATDRARVESLQNDLDRHVPVLASSCAAAPRRHAVSQDSRQFVHTGMWPRFSTSKHTISR
jgi:coiled-coil domain-containing protein 40